MEFADTLLCELCGTEATVVTHHGFDRSGHPIIRPALLETRDGLYVFLDCMVHGRIAQCISAPGDTCLGRTLLKPVLKNPPQAGSLAASRRADAIERSIRSAEIVVRERTGQGGPVIIKFPSQAHESGSDGLSAGRARAAQTM
jgi:hypothetical protein